MAGVESTLVWVVLITICCVQGELVNIALRKPTSTPSGTYCGPRPTNCWNASKAVDGNNSIQGLYRICFHSYNHTLSYWTVDLEQEYQLYDIRVYLRSGFVWRIRNTIIYLDNNSSRVCYTFPSSSRNINNPTNASCNKTARYVTLRDPGLLNVCEVEIYVCSNGTYGSNCDRFCHCPHCDRWTGVCSEDCHPGWEGKRCDTECQASGYGVNCSKLCADRKCNTNTSSCDHVTGSCDTGCRPGYIADDCTEVCDNHLYGTNCSNVCSERHCSGNSSCNHVTGSCDQGCEAGWEGWDCLQACTTDIMYGPGCNKRCHDRKCTDNKRSCNRFNGSCETECQPGWQGPDCIVRCVKMTYGVNCSSVCSERRCYGNSLCDHVTGACDQGCQAGWMGSDCKQACDREHYGPNCTGVCSSRHCDGVSSCSPTTGQCDGGCQTGWKGADCSQEFIQSPPPMAQTTVIAVSVTAVGVLSLILVIISVLIWKRRNRRSLKKTKQEQEHTYYNTATKQVMLKDGLSKKNTSADVTSCDIESTYTTIDCVDNKDKRKSGGDCDVTSRSSSDSGRTYEKLQIGSRDRETEYTGLQGIGSYENMEKIDFRN